MRLVRIFLCIAFVSAAVLAAGCHTRNAGGGGVTIALTASYDRLAQTLTVTLHHSASVDTTITFTAPDWITIEDGSPQTINGGVGTLTLDVTLADDPEDAADVTVTATDANNVQRSEQVLIARPLFIDSVEVTTEPDDGLTQTVVVGVDAPTESEVTVSLTPEAGYTLSGADDQTQSGGGDFTFTFTIDTDPPGGALTSGAIDVQVDASDDSSNTDSESLQVAFTVEGPGLPQRTLVAVPAETAITLGETVTVSVITGPFSAAGPFHYMDGAGVTVEEGAEYAENSFNVGEPGGAADAVDGIWALMDPVPDGFIMPPDSLIQELPTGTAGVVRIDFNVTPIGGAEITGGGTLFNFQLEFTAAGTYNLGFQLFEQVRRTYYSGDDGLPLEWVDFTNDVEGFANSITVTE